MSRTKMARMHAVLMQQKKQFHPTPYPWTKTSARARPHANLGAGCSEHVDPYQDDIHATEYENILPQPYPNLPPLDFPLNHPTRSCNQTHRSKILRPCLWYRLDLATVPSARAPQRAHEPRSRDED